MQDSYLRQQIIKKTTLGAIAGLLVWIVLLAQTSGAIRNAAVGSSSDVTIGPLVLNHMSKQPAEGGAYTVSFSFENGLVGYFVTWMVTGAVIGYGLGKRRGRATR